MALKSVLAPVSLIDVWLTHEVISDLVRRIADRHAVHTESPIVGEGLNRSCHWCRLKGLKGLDSAAGGKCLIDGRSWRAPIARSAEWCGRQRLYLRRTPDHGLLYSPPPPWLRQHHGEPSATPQRRLLIQTTMFTCNYRLSVPLSTRMLFAIVYYSKLSTPFGGRTCVGGVQRAIQVIQRIRAASGPVSCRWHS